MTIGLLDQRPTMSLQGGRVIGFSRSGKMVLDRDTFELIWKAAVGLASFALVMTALTIKGQAQQTGQSKNERVNTEESNTKTSQSDAMMSLTINSTVPQATRSPSPTTQPAETKWHYGGFIDAAYLLDF